MAIPLIQATNTSEEDNYRIRHDEHQPYNALPPNFSNEEPSHIEQASINMVEYPANDSNSEDTINITTSDNDSEEGNESIVPPTSYSAGIHMSGDNTDGEDDSNLLDTNEDNTNKNQIKMLRMSTTRVSST